MFPTMRNMMQLKTKTNMVTALFVVFIYGHAILLTNLSLG